MSDEQLIKYYLSYLTPRETANIDEQLIREYLSNLPQNEIDNSFHLRNLDFEQDSLDDIMNAILSLYLDIAETAKDIANGNENESLVREQESKLQVLTKLLEYEPIANKLSKKLKSGNEHKIKQTS